MPPVDPTTALLITGAVGVLAPTVVSVSAHLQQSRTLRAERDRADLHSQRELLHDIAARVERCRIQTVMLDAERNVDRAVEQFEEIRLEWLDLPPTRARMLLWWPIDSPLIATFDKLEQAGDAALVAALQDEERRPGISERANAWTEAEFEFLEEARRAVGPRVSRGLVSSG